MFRCFTLFRSGENVRDHVGDEAVHLFIVAYVPASLFGQGKDEIAQCDDLWPSASSMSALARRYCRYSTN